MFVSKINAGVAGQLKKEKPAVKKPKKKHTHTEKSPPFKVFRRSPASPPAREVAVTQPGCGVSDVCRGLTLKLSAPNRDVVKGADLLSEPNNIGKGQTLAAANSSPLHSGRKGEFEQQSGQY